MRYLPRVAVILFGIALAGGAPVAQAPTAAKAPVHAKQVKRLLIRNAMVLSGPGRSGRGSNGHPGRGRPDRSNRAIAAIGPRRTRSSTPPANTSCRASSTRTCTGTKSAPGPIPIQYERNLYLAAGVTTAREVGGDFEKSKQWRAESDAHTIVAPRILVYPMLASAKRASIRRDAGRVPRAGPRQAKERGADGLKMIGPMDRDQAAARSTRRSKLGLRTTVHIAVGEATARDYIELGVNCIEHFYGIADAALDGHPGLPAGDEPLERDPPLRPRRRAVHAENLITRSCTK